MISALPPKADIRVTQRHVCFVPEADFVSPDHVTAAHLSHGPWHKTADPYVIALAFYEASVYRPDHGPPGLVMLSDNGIVWHIDPHHDFGVGALWHSHAIVTVLRLPVGIFDDITVGIRTAGAVAALQLVKPRLEWRVRITPVEAAPYRRQWHQPQPHKRDEAD